MNSPENVARTSLLAVTQTAFGFGAGILLARRLQPEVQKPTAFAILSLGLLTTLPIIIDFVQKSINRPGTERSMRRRLDSIRQDSGFPGDTDVF